MEDFKIYLPVDVTGKCVEVQNGDVIRVYDDEIPELGTSVTYTDYYINSHYIDISGSTTLDLHAVCLDNNRITNNYWYRVDFPQIFLVVFIFLFINFFIIKTLISPFFRRIK